MTLYNFKNIVAFFLLLIIIIIPFIDQVLLKVHPITFVNNILSGNFHTISRVIKTNKTALVTTSSLLIISICYSFYSNKLPVQYSIPAICNKIFSNMNSGYRYMSSNRQRLGFNKKTRETKFAIKNGGELGGISNDGNTCFMNSVLQSLASSKHLLKFVDSYLYSEIEVSAEESVTKLKTNTPKPELVFTTALRKFLEGINGSYGSRGKEFSAKPLLNKMPNGPKQNFFTGYNQEDAQEFYQLVMSLVESEYKKVSESRQVSPEPESNEKSPSEKFVDSSKVANLISGCEDLGKLGKVYVPASQVDPNLLEIHHKVYPLDLITPVDGISVERIGCLVCGEVGGIRYSVNSGLSLNLPNNSSYYSGFSLNDLMNDWISPEIIDDVNCNRCGLVQTKEFLEGKIADSNNEKIIEQFQSRVVEIEKELAQPHITDEVFERLTIKQMIRKTRKSKQISLSRPPPLLAMHINRSVFDPRTYTIVKNPSNVTFPSIMDLTPYVTEPKDINMDARLPFRKQDEGSFQKNSFRGPINSTEQEPLTSDSLSFSDKENQEDSTSLNSNIKSDSTESTSDSVSESENSFPSNPKLLYDLKAVISHYGTHNYGHYICYRKLRGSWWRISDESVYVVAQDEVLNSQGTFMLFYEYNDGVKEVLQELNEDEDRDDQDIENNHESRMNGIDNKMLQDDNVVDNKFDQSDNNDEVDGGDDSYESSGLSDGELNVTNENLEENYSATNNDYDIEEGRAFHI